MKIGMLLAGAALLFVLWRLLRRSPENPHQQTAECRACGWRGRVSRYAGRCPACNAPLGDLLAKRKR